MNTKSVALLAIIVAAFACTKPKQVKSYNEGVNIVPLPNEMVVNEGLFTLNKKTVFAAGQGALDTELAYFAAKIKQATGYVLNVVSEKPAHNYIHVSVNEALETSNEGYELNVTSEGVTIEGKTPRAVFYGLQTMMQLLPAEIESSQLVTDVPWFMPCVQIKDEPRFPWRGMHLDVCRHFYSVDFIKKQLDVLAMYKINKFHWHLTEDQGWRIEIKKYPKLTEVGSKRVDEGKEHGGYYTQEEVKEIVAYAADRHIEVVPEIELPGHALAALTAYPEYSCTGGPFKVRNVWGVEPDIYCAGKEETFEFLEDIIDEVVPLFPCEYFHIGGDEAPKTRWEKCPDCQKRIKAEGLHSEHELQSYFIKRIEKVLLNHGKKMVGWDEILEGGLAKSASVMSWRGEEGGITAASQGHDVIMTPGDWVYLDHYQGSPKVEPVAIGGHTTLKESYGYEPVPKELPADKVHHVLGTQGNVWSEYMYTPEIAEYRIYPRIIALAEVNWTNADKKDFEDFTKRMDNQHVRLDMHGINYHVPLPEGPINRVAFTDSATLKFKTTRPLSMYYTTDGTEPNMESSVYEAPLTFKESTNLKIRTALSTGKMSPVRTIQVDKQSFRVAHQVNATKNGLKLKEADGEFYSTKELKGIDQWREREITDYDAVNKEFDYKQPGVGIFEGYLNIAEDGIYHFSSNMDELYVSGELLIDNDGEVKRYSRNDASIALKAGLHPIKMVFINNVFGGWPQEWNGVRIHYKKLEDVRLIELRPKDFLYE
jgi:hexosaminidase